MRPQTPFPSKTERQITHILKNPKDVGELKRAQCILFRARNNMDSDTISNLVGMSAGSVRNVHSKYIKQGIKSIPSKPKGGRYRYNFEKNEEKELLQKFEKKAQKGGILEVSFIHRAYEKKLGRSVPKSTVYYMLARHGWRKLAPRPHHPKGDQKVIADFKKISENKLEKLEKGRWQKVSPSE